MAETTANTTAAVAASSAVLIEAARLTSLARRCNGNRRAKSMGSRSQPITRVPADAFAPTTTARNPTDIRPRH